MFQPRGLELFTAVIRHLEVITDLQDYSVQSFDGKFALGHMPKIYEHRIRFEVTDFV